MPINNGVGLLASVLQNQQAARQRAALSDAEMAQRQDMMDQGQEFQSQTLAQQLKAQALAQAMHAQQAVAAQAAQDAREQARIAAQNQREDAKLAGADARDAQRWTAEQAIKNAQLVFEREQLAKRDEWERLRLEKADKPHTTISYNMTPKPPPPDDYRRDPLTGQIANFRAQWAKDKEVFGQSVAATNPNAKGPEKPKQLELAEELFARKYGILPPDDVGAVAPPPPTQMAPPQAGTKVPRATAVFTRPP